MCRPIHYTTFCPRCMSPYTAGQGKLNNGAILTREVVICNNAYNRRQVCESAISNIGPDGLEHPTPTFERLVEDFCDRCTSNLNFRHEVSEPTPPSPDFAFSTPCVRPQPLSFITADQETASTCTTSNCIKGGIDYFGYPVDNRQGRKSNIWIDVLDGNHIMAVPDRKNKKNHKAKNNTRSDASVVQARVQDMSCAEYMDSKPRLKRVAKETKGMTCQKARTRLPVDKKYREKAKQENDKAKNNASSNGPVHGCGRVRRMTCEEAARREAINEGLRKTPEGANPKATAELFSRAKLSPFTAAELEEHKKNNAEPVPQTPSAFPPKSLFGPKIPDVLKKRSADGKALFGQSVLIGKITKKRSADGPISTLFGDRSGKRVHFDFEEMVAKPTKESAKGAKGAKSVRDVKSVKGAKGMKKPKRTRALLPRKAKETKSD